MISQEVQALDAYAIRLRERARRYEDDADPYIRGLIATQIYRDFPDMPVVRKRAQILARTLEQITPVVLPEDCIMGSVYRRRKVHRGVSEENGWRIQVFFPENGPYREEWPIPAEIKDHLRWWQNHKIDTTEINSSRKANLWLGRYGIAWPMVCRMGIRCPIMEFYLHMVCQN